MHMIADRIEPTISLAIVTLIFSVAVAVPIGIIAAWKQGSWIDRSIMALSVAGFSVPVFVLGYILIYVFSLKLDLLPVQGFVSLREGLWPFLQHMIQIGRAPVLTPVTNAQLLCRHLH